jgi:hypothetical protein
MEMLKREIIPLFLYEHDARFNTIDHYDRIHSLAPERE